ncbi:MAG: hypothetical protein JF597_38785 [Streptomyces sp.]|uniref:hypothetical protein n=1 Tax=Streptomyces sp. TaxID=1931 RepID=UPI0025F6986F|nr:hypothetical protein [Streptomyces sp.]MBW8799305.1 hypothetical protein [Streptomyces sp.]
MTPRLRLPRASNRPPVQARLALVRPLLVRLLPVLAALLLPCGTAVAYGPDPVPSDSASASATPEPSLAGTVAGEGRMRPGRPQGPATKVEDQDPDDPDDHGVPDDPDEPDDHGGLGEATATESAGSGVGSPAATSAQPPREAVLAPTSPPPHPAGQAMGSGQDDDTEPVLQILPLGSGLVLIGLGLGLAFVGLRVRRG